MDLNSYSTWTRTTWVAPGRLDGDLALCALGLAGETGEAVEVIKKYLRDGRLDRDKLVKELGDSLYYWARLCAMFELSPEYVIKVNVEKLTDRKERGVLKGQGGNR